MAVYSEDLGRACEDFEKENNWWNHEDPPPKVSQKQGVVVATPQVLPEKEVKLLSFDLDKLARAVARHETADCTKGSAKYNNCHGIRRNGQFMRYKTKEDSYRDFKDIWTKYYKRFPDLALARKYSGSDRPHNWLANVTLFYNQQF